MSGFDPVMRLLNLAHRFNCIAGNARSHETMSLSAMNAALKTAEHCASALEQDLNHRDASAAAGEMLDAHATAKTAEEEYAR